jgi:monovalent cation/hydrogen antiporter
MEIVHLLIVLFLFAIGLSWAARRLKLPYPIALVVGGTALGFVPLMPRFTFDPNLVMVIVLPPILYSAAFFTSWRDFRRWLRSITMLSTGLVLATTCVIAAVAHYLIGLPWPIAFALGAIVSPPDAVAATSILGRMKLPRRIITILEGESLVNDASGLVLYKFAVVAAVTGTFSLAEASAQFVLVAVGGVALGLVMGKLFAVLHRPLKDPLIEVTLTIVAPYVTYLLAEAVHVSGVLAVVAAGLLQGRSSVEAFTAETRILGTNVWAIMVFLLNTLIFILIGLSLPGILAGLEQYGIATLIGYAAAVSVAAIVIRMLWVFPGAYLPPLLIKRIRESEGFVRWQWVVLSGWCGMRGIVSLAAALALPEMTSTGAPLPGRDLVIFLTFAVIIVTLVLQGLTLIPLTRMLRIGGDWSGLDEQHLARRRVAEAALEEIRRVGREDQIATETIEHVCAEYQLRLARSHPTRLVLTEGDDPVVRLRRAALQAERRELIKLWRAQEIGDEVLHHLESELDLEEARLRR